MPVGQQTKYGKRILAIIGCFAVWLLYTLIFRQIIRFDDNKTPAKSLDLKQETYEIDRRVSVCFKDVAPFSMLLKQDANVCRNIHDLLIVVHTDPSNFQLRAEFRKTLRKIKREATINNLQIDSVFMLGLDENLCISSTLLQEMSLEKDVMIGSYIDSNDNQTLKSVQTLKWFHENCSNSKLLLKVSGKMNPNMSFSTKQFYKLLKSKRNQNIVLLGSKNMPKLLSKSGLVSHSGLTTTILDPTSAQYLHLNYLLSRNVVISLLKARADAINISAWKEDLFVTGVLVNVAQLRLEHDEQFLRQCAGALCIFCECSMDLERQIDFRQPSYSAQSLTKLTKESAQPVAKLIFQTDSTWTINQQAQTTVTDQTLSITTNAATKLFTEYSTLTSITPSFMEATTILKNEFTTLSKSIREITNTEGTQTTTNVPVSTIFTHERTDTTTECSSQFTDVSYTTTEQSLQSQESEHFMVTATTQDKNMLSLSTLTEVPENRITDTARLTTDYVISYASLRESSGVTETSATQTSKMNVELDVTSGTTPTKAYDLIASTTDQNIIGTEVPALTISGHDADTKTIPTSYATADFIQLTEATHDSDITSSLISDKFTSTINVVLKNAEENNIFVSQLQEVGEPQGLSSTNTVGMTTFHSETTKRPHLYISEDGLQTENFQGDIFTGDNGYGEEHQYLKQKTAMQANELQTATVSEPSYILTDTTTENLLEVTTNQSANGGQTSSHSLLEVTPFESGRQNFPEISTNSEEELVTEPVIKFTSANMENISPREPVLVSTSINFEHVNPSTTQDSSTVINDIIPERTTQTNKKLEVTENSIPSICNPVSLLRGTEFLKIPIQPENLETIQTVADNSYTTTDSTKETTRKVFLQNSDVIDATEKFSFNYSSHVQDVKNLSRLGDNSPKTFFIHLTSNLTNLTDVYESINLSHPSSYILTNSPKDSPPINFSSSTNNTTIFEKTEQFSDALDKNKSIPTRQNLHKYFPSQILSSESDSATKKYISSFFVDHQSISDSKKYGINNASKIPIFNEFKMLSSKTKPKEAYFNQTTIPRQRVKVRISSSTSKTETLQLKSAPSLSSKIEFRVTSSISMAANGGKKLQNRKLRRKRKMKKIVIRIHRASMKLPTTKTSGVLRKP